MSERKPKFIEVDPLDALIKNWRWTGPASQVVMGVYHFCADELESVRAAHDALVSRRAQIEAIEQCAIEAGERSPEGVSSHTMLGDMWDERISKLRALANPESGNSTETHRRRSRVAGPEGQVSRLDELQQEFIERHKDADLVECNLAPPKGNGKVIRAIYLSPEYQANEPARRFFQLVREEEERQAEHERKG